MPVPPPRIQGTLLRAAVTSPKLAGRLNRPVSMATGLENRLSPSSSPLPPHTFASLNRPHSGENSPLSFSGMTIRPESIALLEENWKKLEKNGRLQQWNLKSMYNVVKSPRRKFLLTKFTRPGSFRKKKSPLTTDDYSHSDNELEDSLTLSHGQSHLIPSDLLYPPEKPPRTYTTTHADVYSRGSKALFNPDGDDFSSDLMSTFERLGSVYSISGLLGEEMDGNEETEPKPHRKIMRSVSSIAEFNQTSVTQSDAEEDVMKIPKINVIPNASFDNDLKEEDEREIIESCKLSLQREISRSVGSIPNMDDGTIMDHLNVVPKMAINEEDSDDQDIGLLDDTDIDDIKDRTLKHIDFSQYVPDDDDSSVDSYQSAQDRNEFLSRQHSSSPHEIIRPDSEASELFHTPPNSLSPSPTGLESISPSQITNIGLALGVNIKLEDSQSSVKRPDGCHGDINDLSLLGDLTDVHLEEDNDEDLNRYVSASSNVENTLTRPKKAVVTNHRTIGDKVTPEEVTINSESLNDEGASLSQNHVADDNFSVDLVSSKDTPPDLSPAAGDHETDDANENELGELDKVPSDAVFHSDQYSEYDVHIVPEDISPTKVTIHTIHNTVESLGTIGTSWSVLNKEVSLFIIVFILIFGFDSTRCPE